MAERTAEQVRTRLKNQLIYYDPGFHVSGETPYDVPPEYRQIIGGSLGTRQLTPEEAASAAGVSVEQLKSLEPDLDLGVNERTALLQKYVTPAGGTGFFSSLLGGVGGVIGGLTDTVVDPVANALGVHPDAVKAAAALAGMYYAGGGTFFDTATNAIVPEATAVELIAPQLGAETLGAAAAAPAAGAGLSAAEIAALGAEGLAVPAPVATAFPVPMPGAASPINMMAFPGDIIDGSLGQAYNALGVGAAEPATVAANALAGDIIDGSLGQAYNALGVGAAEPATAAAVPGLNFEQIAAESLGANLPGVAEGVSGSSVFTPATAATTAVTNALMPTLNHEQIAAESLGANVPGVAEGVSGSSVFVPTTLPNVLPPPINHEQIAAESLGAGLPGAAEGVSGAAALTGAGLAGAAGAGAGAAALTGAGLAGAAGAGAGILGSNALVPLALAGTGALGAITARSAAETQSDAARYAADKAYQIYQEQKALQEPFRTAGITAQNQLLTLLGLQGGTPGAEFGKYARPFGMQDFQADPGYAFRLSEGLKALEASRAARGGLLSGATGKALSRYGQDLASQEYGSAFNRYQTERANRLAPLGSLLSTGQAAASNQSAAAGQYGTNVGNLAISGAAAQAAGQVGMANALTGSLNAYLNYSANQNLVNALQDAAVRRASMYG